MLHKSLKLWTALSNSSKLRTPCSELNFNMFFVCILWIALQLLSPIHGQTCSSNDDSCRQLEFRLDHTFDNKRLKSHVIRSVDAIDADFCEMVCYMEPNCVSFNFKKSTSKCELNNSTFEGQKNKLEENPDYIYRGAKNACREKPCKNKATCQTGYTDKGYRCLCTPGFIGQHCEKAVKSCQDAYLENMKELSVSQVVTLVLDSKPTSVFCHMGIFGCGDGGWTPVLKMDGNERTFHYDSNLWSNKETFNLEGGKTGFDANETKLPSYWSTSFSKICLGMMIDDQLKNFINITKQANSLYSLIADGEYRNTSLGRDTWKYLIGSEASLQLNCNKEGFNAVSDWNDSSKARIGILGNNENHCSTCDSRIGFGTGGKHDDSNTCGNEAVALPDNGDKHIKAIGYILVQ